MKVSRSGYYKWLKNKENLNNYELNRKDLGILIKDIHTKKPSYGYHRINAIIRRKTLDEKKKLITLMNFFFYRLNNIL